MDIARPAREAGGALTVAALILLWAICAACVGCSVGLGWAAWRALGSDEEDEQTTGLIAQDLALAFLVASVLAAALALLTMAAPVLATAPITP